MTRVRKLLLVLLAIVAILVIVLAGLVWWQRPLLLTGTGYAAHNACAMHFVAGRDDIDTDLPPNPLVPYLRSDVDSREGSATSDVLGVAFDQTAWATENGCVVAADRPAEDFDADEPGVRLAEVPSGGISLDAVARDVPEAVLEAERRALDATAEVDGTRSLVVVRDGAVAGEWYADGFDANRRQLAWSVTKSVTNALVGRVAAGAVEGVTIDPSETGLLPEWTDERSEISLDDLLRMQSGLEWDETYELGTPITTMLYREPDMAAYAASLPLAHEPGSFRQYSSGSTNIVCEVLSERTGLRGGLASKLLFEPLGMDSAIVEPDASGTLVCGSYLWATPRDLAKFGEFFRLGGEVGGEQLLPEDWLEYSLTDNPTGGEEGYYGSQWWLNSGATGAPAFPTLPEDTFWASGHDGQFVVVVPSEELVVVRTGFTPDVTFTSSGVPDLVAELIAATE